MLWMYGHKCKILNISHDGQIINSRTWDIFVENVCLRLQYIEMGMWFTACFPLSRLWKKWKNASLGHKSGIERIFYFILNVIRKLLISDWPRTAVRYPVSIGPFMLGEKCARVYAHAPIWPSAFEIYLPSASGNCRFICSFITFWEAGAAHVAWQRSSCRSDISWSCKSVGMGDHPPHEVEGRRTDMGV